MNRLSPSVRIATGTAAIFVSGIMAVVALRSLLADSTTKAVTGLIRSSAGTPAADHTVLYLIVLAVAALVFVMGVVFVFSGIAQLLGRAGRYAVKVADEHDLAEKSQAAFHKAREASSDAGKEVKVLLDAGITKAKGHLDAPDGAAPQLEAGSSRSVIDMGSPASDVGESPRD